jgi:hypothetical protein
MTISAVHRVDYTGNGATDTYDYTFKIFDRSHLRVTTRYNGTSTVLPPTAYSVTGVGNPNGGTITLVNGALQDGVRLTIRRVLPLIQETDLRNQGGYYPDTTEDEIDRNIMIDQQLQDQLDRALMRPEGWDPDTDGFNNFLPEPIPYYLLGWNSTGTTIVNYPPSSAGNVGGVPDFLLQNAGIT